MRLPQLSAVIAAALLALPGCWERSGQATANGKGPATAPASAAAGAATAPGAAAPAQAAVAGQAAAPAGDAPPAADKPAVKTVNTRDPVDGLPVDPAIEPVVVDLDMVRPPLTLVIGVSSAENAARVKADPQKYAAAAARNGVARRDTDAHQPR
jgi:hypothetical protein